MSTVVVVGAQWGDEGKGKITDLLSQEADVVVRYQGGNNAGHTVVVDGEEFKLHLIPSGILNPDCQCLMGDGTVVDPACLLAEVVGLQARGLSCANLKIGYNASVIMPYHKVLDGIEEEGRGAASIGTTRRGIGPVYTDKVARMPVPVRFRDLCDEKRLRELIAGQLAVKNRLLSAVYDAPAMDPEAVFAEVWEPAQQVSHFAADIRLLVQQAVKAGRRVIFEGAQGTFLDLDYGTFPYVTSSHPVAGGACLGTGVGPTAMNDVLIIAKAYTTRVGAGVFPTECLDQYGETLRDRGAEYGTTTGRPRRCGWLDGVILHTSAMLNSATAMAVTKLDVLDGFETLQVCTGYRLDGELLDTVPSWPEDVERAVPVYEEMPGWQQSICEARRWEDLPVQARAYLDRMSELAGVPITIVSVGHGRHQTILR
ncbi:MAG TPA: adenylosuccinate synthase [Armatimonadota bacterium]|jgi:adenylosuccinate synthase